MKRFMALSVLLAACVVFMPSVKAIEPDFSLLQTYSDTGNAYGQPLSHCDFNNDGYLDIAIENYRSGSYSGTSQANSGKVYPYFGGGYLGGNLRFYGDVSGYYLGSK